MTQSLFRVQLDDFTSLLAPEVNTGAAPSPVGLKRVRNALKAGQTLESIRRDHDGDGDIDQALAYVQAELAQFPEGKVKVYSERTGKVIALLDPAKHLWTPPANYKEQGEDGDIVARKGPGLSRVHPDIASFLIVREADAERLERAYLKLVERDPSLTGRSDPRLALAMPEARNSVVEYLREHLPASFPRMVPRHLRMPWKWVDTLDEGEEVRLLADVRIRIPDVLAGNPRFDHGHHAEAQVQHAWMVALADLVYKALQDEPPSSLRGHTHGYALVPSNAVSDPRMEAFRIGVKDTPIGVVINGYCGQVCLQSMRVEHREVNDRWEIRAEALVKVALDLTSTHSFPVRLFDSKAEVVR